MLCMSVSQQLRSIWPPPPFLSSNMYSYYWEFFQLHVRQSEPNWSELLWNTHAKHHIMTCCKWWWTACLFLGNESKTTETNVTRRPAQSVVDQSWIKMAATFPTLPPIFSFTWWGKTSTRQGLGAEWKQGTYWCRTNQCFLLTVSCKCPVYWFFQSSSTVLSEETNKSQGTKGVLLVKRNYLERRNQVTGRNGQM